MIRDPSYLMISSIDMNPPFPRCSITAISAPSASLHIPSATSAYLPGAPVPPRLSSSNVPSSSICFALTWFSCVRNSSRPVHACTNMLRSLAENSQRTQAAGSDESDGAETAFRLGPQG